MDTDNELKYRGGRTLRKAGMTVKECILVEILTAEKRPESDRCIESGMVWEPLWRGGTWGAPWSIAY